MNEAVNYFDLVWLSKEHVYLCDLVPCTNTNLLYNIKLTTSRGIGNIWWANAYDSGESLKFKLQ